MADSLSLGALLGTPQPLAGLMGAGAGLEGVAGGGLFQALLSEAEPALTQAGLAQPPAGAAGGVAPALAAPASQGLTVPLAEGGVELQLEGELLAVQLLVQRVTVLYQELTLQGGLTMGGPAEGGLLGALGGKQGATAQLAQALTTLGMAPAEAQALAARIDTMLALLEAQLEQQGVALEPAQAQALAGVLLAALLTPAQAQALQLPSQEGLQAQLAVAVTHVQVAVNRTSWLGVQARAQVAPDALALLQPAAPAVAFPASAAGAAAPVIQVALHVAEVPGDMGTQLQFALPQGTLAGPRAQAQPLAPIPVEVVPAPTMPTGDVLYRLVDNAAGQAELQVLARPLAEVKAGRAELLPAASQAASPTASLGPVMAAPLGSVTTVPAPLAAELGALPEFASRLEQAYQAHTARQVQLAFQPLLANGQGGSVQMTLNPPELGRLEIHLRVEHGQVQGTIAAQEPGVLEHLARELPTLRQSFQEAGLKIGEQGLSLMLGQQDAHDQSSAGRNPFAEATETRQNARNDAELVAEGALNAALPTTSAARWVAPTQLLDLDA